MPGLIRHILWRYLLTRCTYSMKNLESASPRKFGCHFQQVSRVTSWIDVRERLMDRRF